MIRIELKHAIIRQGSEIDGEFEDREGEMLQRNANMSTCSAIDNETLPRFITMESKSVVENENWSQDPMGIHFNFFAGKYLPIELEEIP